MSLRRDWKDARAKVELEGRCRICTRSDRKLDAAHIMGSETVDRFELDGTRIRIKSLYVEPVRIVPLCGPYPEGCHGDQEHYRVDLLPHLTLDEQVQAVRDAGGIEAARRRLCPSDFTKPSNQEETALAAPGRSGT